MNLVVSFYSFIKYLCFTLKGNNMNVHKIFHWCLIFHCGPPHAYFITSFQENRLWDTDLHAGGLLGMWFQEVRMRGTGKEPGEEEEPIQWGITNGKWCSTIKNILWSIWNTFPSYLPRGQKKEEFIHQLSCPTDPACSFLYTPGLHACMCQKDFHDAHTVISEKPHSRKLQTYATSVRQGPFRMHRPKLSKDHCNHWTKRWD